MLIDTQVLFKHKLNLEQYFFLLCLALKQTDYIKKYNNEIKKFKKADILYLLDKKYIVELNSPFSKIEDLELSESSYSLLGFKKNKEWFEEFWLKYPRITPNGRVLKQISKSKAEQKYLLRVKSKEKHDHVLKCLEKEINHLTQTNKINYMLNIETWLNNNGWEAFEEESESSTSKKTYGTDID